MTEAPDLAPRPGWSSVDEALPRLFREAAVFVSGDPSGNRFRVRYYRRDADGAVVGKAWFGPDCQGPPGYAHGGSHAALLDEAMGAACMLAGHMGLAVRLEVSFRRALPLRTVVEVQAWLLGVEGRKVSTRSRLQDADGTLYSEAEGLFIKLPSMGASAPPRTP